MSPLEIKLLHGEAALFQHLDGIIDRHPVCATLVILYLLLLLLVLVIVNVARRKAKGLIRSGSRVIYIQSPASPSQPEEPAFDPFPPMQERDYKHEDFIDPDNREH